MVCCKWRHCQQHSRVTWARRTVLLVYAVYQYAMRGLGPVLFIGANGLIISITLCFLFVFYPELYQTSALAYCLNMLFAIYILTNILFNYFACAFTAPGSPSYCPDPSKILGEKVSIVDGRKIYQFSYHLNVAPNVSYRYCHGCKCIKPPRAHHCSVLGRCVLNMDHYCPWMSNTVGYYNYRYFVLFLIYLFIGCVYVVLFFLVGAVKLSPIDESFILLNSMFQTNMFHANSLTASVYCFSLALSAIVSAGLLLVWHAYLTITNQVSVCIL
jgi:palmitoyltransferase